MTEQLPTHHFTIANATHEDVAGIGVAHFESMRAVYPNEQAGIDEAWIDKNWRFFKEQSGNEFRAKTVEKAVANPDRILYLAAKDPEGKVVGFVHATRDDGSAKLEALYLLPEAQGSGLADDLMARALGFGGDLMMELQVADYNDRAIAFYQKHGFQIVPDSQEILKEKLPVVGMKRLPLGEGSDEV